MKMTSPDGKFLTTMKIGPKGQIIVPKEVRDMFHVQPGDMLLMLADADRGVALQTFDNADEMFKRLFPTKE